MNNDTVINAFKEIQKLTSTGMADLATNSDLDPVSQKQFDALFRTYNIVTEQIKLLLQQNN